MRAPRLIREAMRTVKNEPQARIRLLKERDLVEAMRLVAPANWNQTRQDWQRVLRFAPQGCFGLWLHGRLVATGTTTIYGNARTPITCRESPAVDRP